MMFRKESPVRRAKLALLALTALAVPARASAAPTSNAVQQKYITRQGESRCAPSGTLKELVSGKYQCYGPAGADKCAASVDAVKGSLDPAFVTLFGDLVKADDAGFLYASGCKGVDGADFIQSVAVGGIGYAKSTANFDALLALATPKRLDQASGQDRSELIASLGRFGDAQKGKLVPAFKTALATEGRLLDFKKNALKFLVRFGSDDGVAYCLDVLQKGNDQDVGKVCAWYLGERKANAAGPTLQRHYDEDQPTFGRALGLLGSKDAAAVLKAQYEKDVGSAVALPTTVALLNVGDKSYDYAGDLVLLLQGKRPLSLRERAKKTEEFAKKRKGTVERWKERESEASEESAVAAAIEATYAVDPGAAKKIDDALRVTAARTDWVKASARATSALAQRGDRPAVANLVKLLTSTKKEARDIALDALGARYDNPQGYLEYVGRKGVVADPSAVPALVTFMANESDEATRTSALRAIGAIRSFL